MTRKVRILLTSGGTKVKIDRVRHIGNMSRGNFPSKIARALLDQSNHELGNLTFFKAAESWTPFGKTIDPAEMTENEADQAYMEALRLRVMHRMYREQYIQRTYKTFQDYEAGIDTLCSDVYGPWDVIVLAAAVSDYLVKNYVDGKIRSAEDLGIELDPAPKVISTIKAKQPHAILVGFKLMVNSKDEELVAAAKKSCDENGCLFVVANDLRDIVANNHRLLIVHNNNGPVHEYLTDPNDPEYLAKIVAKLVWRAWRCSYSPSSSWSISRTNQEQ